MADFEATWAKEKEKNHGKQDRQAAKRKIKLEDEDAASSWDKKYTLTKKFLRIKDSLCISYVIRCFLVSMCSMRISF